MKIEQTYYDQEYYITVHEYMNKNEYISKIRKYTVDDK